MELTEDDVFEIIKLVEQSNFDFFQLEEGELKLTIARNGYTPSAAEGAAPPVPVAETGGPTAATAPSSPLRARSPAVPEADEGLVTISAPMVGTFYSAPSPDDPPYVEKGARVAVGVTLGLIEAMKVFTAIQAEVGGTVEDILVTNTQFVEYGQALFRIRPDEPEGPP